MAAPTTTTRQSTAKTTGTPVAKPAPGAAAPPAKLVAACGVCLRKRERMMWCKLVGWILLGVAGCLAPVLLIGTFLWLMQLRNWDVPQWPWLKMLAINAVVIVPILFALHFAVCGFTGAKAGGEETTAGVQRSMAGLFFGDMCLWGPKMITTSIRRGWRSRKCSGRDSQLAAQTVARLLRNESGLSTADVMSRTDDTAVATFTYLAFHDWIDFSRDGDRVWLLGESRQLLRAATK